MKFKKNDCVKIIKNMTGHGFPIGTIAKITRVDADCYGIADLNGERKMYAIDEELELVKNAYRITIFSYDNKITTAVKEINGVTIGESTAICHENDVFDFDTGADICLKRLRYINGDIVCINAKDKAFTVGKIYHCENGKFEDNFGYVRPLGNELLTEDNITTFFEDSKFIKIVN